MTQNHAAAELGGLARHLRGRVILPGEQDWDRVRQPWNCRIDQRPAAVVEPEAADDMAATVSFAAHSGLHVTVQSSGHGAGDSLEDTILLRTGRLREITVDPARDLARVGAGVRCADLAAAASPHDLAVSIGSAHDVGVAGYAMFGGMGMLGRRFGFIAHQITAADVITADGRPLRCDAATHQDLWWALRGGGGGFALVTRLELRLPRLPALFGGQIVWPLEAAAEVFSAWRSWTALLPPEMTSSVCVIHLPALPEVPEPMRDRRAIVVTLCYAGPVGVGDNLVRPLAEVTAPLFNSCRRLAPADVVTLASAPPTPLPSRVRVELLDDLPDAAVRAFTQYVGEGSGSPLLLAEIRHLGGAYTDDENLGAIGRIGARYLVELVGLAPDEEADSMIRDYQQRVADVLSQWTTGTLTPNFAHTDSFTDPGRVFPPATRRRLAEVKRRYDPANVLRASFLF